jgi:hypothetical protein
MTRDDNDSGSKLVLGSSPSVGSKRPAKRTLLFSVLGDELCAPFGLVLSLGASLPASERGLQRSGPSRRPQATSGRPCNVPTIATATTRRLLSAKSSSRASCSRHGCCSSRAGAQEWRPTRSLAREGGRGLMSRLSPPHRHSSGGCCGTRVSGTPGRAPVCRQSARNGFR